MFVAVQRTVEDDFGMGRAPMHFELPTARDNGLKTHVDTPPGERYGRNGNRGFGSNWSLTVYQKLGISGPGGPGLYSFTILLVILTVVFLLLWPGTHGKAGALKANAYLLIILALLGFYIAFGFFFPGFPGGALPF